MLTFFAIPKPFRGHFGLIQTNAIRSWTHLKPRPEIILLGDDEGTAEIAAELGLRHFPEIRRNEYGTPLVNHMFECAENLSSSDLICYVNADIILMSDFMEAVKKVIGAMGKAPFLVIGRKRTVEILELLDFKQPDWESPLRNRALAQGYFVTSDSDYFLFPKGMYREIPPFAVGRCFWSPWFVYDARRRGIPVIDATAAVMAVESKHDYSHAASTGGAQRLGGVEFEINRRLFKGCKYYTTMDATHVLTSSGLKRGPPTNRLRSLFVRAQYSLYFFARRTVPYSLPLILLYRATRRLWKTLEQVLFSPAR